VRPRGTVQRAKSERASRGLAKCSHGSGHDGRACVRVHELPYVNYFAELLKGEAIIVVKFDFDWVSFRDHHCGGVAIAHDAIAGFVGQKTPHAAKLRELLGCCVVKSDCQEHGSFSIGLNVHRSRESLCQLWPWSPIEPRNTSAARQSPRQHFWARSGLACSLILSSRLVPVSILLWSDPAGTEQNSRFSPCGFKCCVWSSRRKQGFCGVERPTGQWGQNERACQTAANPHHG